MTTNYYLKSEINKDQTQSIVLFIRYDGNLIRFGTGQKIKATDWNPKKNIQRARTSFLGHHDFNLILDNLENKAKNIYSKCIATGQPAYSEHIHNELNKFMNKDVNLNPNNEKIFMDNFEQFINEAQVAEKTITKYRNTKNNLQKFIDKTKFQLSFENINANFYSKYWKHFSDNDNEDIHFWKNIKIIKQFLGWSLERELHSNIKFIKALKTGPDKGKGKKYKKMIIALTWQELM